MTNKRQVATLKKLLVESRDLYPMVEVETKTVKNRASEKDDGTSRQIDRVMGALAAEGWQPMDDDGFDD